jgi:hydroxyethylthiazole kinase-like uncharacterized protein yjeF
LLWNNTKKKKIIVYNMLMRKVFKEVGSLDQKCYKKYHLSKDVLMEHAAIGLKNALPKKSKSVLIVCGSGNNGADGVVLARLLQEDKKVDLYLPYGVKSPMAKLQLKRANSIGIKEIDFIGRDYDVVVDCIFGSGLNRKLDENTVKLIENINKLDAYKIACDIPTGMIFKADITVTMGALKEILFSDRAKDFVGKIKCVDLGVSHKLYENETDTFLLQKSDMNLPIRTKKNSHKGNFGHLSVVAGKKQGAGVIAATAAYAFGVGLVTVVDNEFYNLPYELMQSTTLPHNNTAICIGMGLGNQFDDDCLSKFLLGHDTPMVIDADLFYQDILLKVLEKNSNLVLTPHPKEFASLLKLTNLADVDVEDIQNDRFKYARLFSQKYPKVVLILKGANTLIARGNKVYIQRFGTNRLSKGGSGDILAGLIGSLLAQRYNPLDAAITASLAHALSAKRFKKNSYALGSKELIEGIKSL